MLKARSCVEHSHRATGQNGHPNRYTLSEMKTSSKFVTLIGVITLGIAIGIIRNRNIDIAVEFSLTDQTGQRVTQEHLAGRYLLVFFGFTNCNQICPAAMTKLTQVVTALDNDGLADRTTPVFISVDAHRDTVDAVKSYVQSFHHRFVGLTGSDAALKSAADSFNTYFITQSPGEFGGYDVAHSPFVFIVDPKSRLVSYILRNASVEEAVQQIKEIIL